MSKLWGGRFAAGGLDPEFERFNRSLPFDQRLLEQDLQGSAAWARALGAVGVLKKTEVQKLTRGLERLRREYCRKDVRIDQDPDEDVHSWVERKLGELTGSLAKKLHSGRSRNDQVATDLKLWLRGRCAELDGALAEVLGSLVELAARCADLPIPGYTHLQRAQPITAGHHALAYVEMLARDRERLQEAADRMETSPLGCGALAGSGFAVDRRALAKDLGFRRGPARNSLDAVSDRDHVCELLFVCSLCLTHLSRLAEDWIFFASHEARFLRFSDAVSTGSSLMPQKKNPDAMELIRGKVGRVQGRLVAMLTTLKALPLAYDKDLQEDKEGLFDALDTTLGCLKVMATAVRGVEYDVERCTAASREGYLNATDLADLLVEVGVPFREAHERVGIAVRRAMEHGVELEGLPKAVQEELFPELERGLARELRLERVLARRKAIGGTAPSRVRQEVKAWQKRL